MKETKQHVFNECFIFTLIFELASQPHPQGFFSLDVKTVTSRETKPWRRHFALAPALFFSFFFSWGLYIKIFIQARFLGSATIILYVNNVQETKQHKYVKVKLYFILLCTQFIWVINWENWVEMSGCNRARCSPRIPRCVIYPSMAHQGIFCCSLAHQGIFCGTSGHLFHTHSAYFIFIILFWHTGIFFTLTVHILYNLISHVTYLNSGTNWHLFRTHSTYFST